MPNTKDIFSIGILVISDRAARKQYPDLSGPAVEAVLKKYLDSAWEPICKVVPDEKPAIQNALKTLVKKKCALILTSGGTGPAPRDVTPEATEAVCEKILPGFGEQMRAVSIKEVPTAILSRQTAGIKGRTLIINLPGKPAAIQPCLKSIFAAIPDCLFLLGWPELKCDPKYIRNAHCRHK